jgi:hypothetical protein
MKLKVSPGGVPPGAYLAKFLGISPVEADALRGYGEGVRWEFEVTTGPQAGRKTSRITTATPTQKNACGRLLAGMLGRGLADDEDVDLTPLVGRVFMIVVAKTKGGGGRVETVSPPPA